MFYLFIKPMRLTALLLCLFLHYESTAQQAIGSWREYLPYLHGSKIQSAGNRVFCVTDESVFAVNKSDHTIERFSKLNGLNDFGISAVNYSSKYHKLLICYNNANIDLLTDDNAVINLSDIKRKNIPGNKTIHSIYMDGDNALLACGFGVVVLNLDRNEVSETWFIGTAGAQVNVFAVTSDADNYYAVTDDAVYTASRNSLNLSDYNNWSVLFTTTTGTFTSATVVNSVLIANLHRTANDTLMAWQNNVPFSLPASVASSSGLKSMRLQNDRLLLVTNDNIIEADNNFNVLTTLTAADIPDLKSSDAEMTEEGSFWIADREKGMIHFQNNNVTTYIPSGPNSAAVAAMEVVNGRLWVMHGPKNRGWTNQFGYAGFSYLKEGSWVTYDGYTSHTPLFSQYVFYDNMSVSVDPSNEEHLFIGSGGAGLLEFNAGQVAGFYRENNSTLKQQVGNPGQVKVHGIRYDENADLWVSNAGVQSVLNVRKPDGQWKAFNFPGKINNSAKTGDLVIDRNGFKWLSVFENIGGADGMLVFNDNGTIDNITDDESALVDFGSNRVRSIAVDHDGTIWAGLDAGIALFYPPSTDPQKIIIKQDNSNQYLLETESITTIAIDGANRKWMGTEASGVYLVSADGQEQLKHFTVDNSPLFSNNVISIAIDGKSGTVYIGTDAGLISYQGDAVEGAETCDEPLVYPNPVAAAYTGPIAVKGVPANATVKITDVAGGLVYEGTALGGQAVWDGNDLHGTRVSTGVYLVFTVSTDGLNSCRTKLMFYH